MSEETTRDILAYNDRYDLEKLLHKYKEKSLNARMKCDPKFATSPIFIDDTLLQDAANWILQSETLQETVCDAIIANGAV